MNTFRDRLLSPDWLAQAIRDARERTLEIAADLTDEQLMGPRLETVNPLLWEIGHVAWFQEFWTLRRGGERPSLRRDADSLYDSIAIPHEVRWDLPLPTREETTTYLREVRDNVLRELAEDPTPERLYFVALSLFHEDMHDEAFTYTRQTLGYPFPPLFQRGGSPADSRAPSSLVSPGAREQMEAGSSIRLNAPTGRMRSASTPDPATYSAAPEASSLAQPETGTGNASLGDAVVPGARFMLGASVEEPFVFDNEKWSHPVDVKTFSIARTAVTQEQFARFVQDEGYRRRDLWSDGGWSWHKESGADHPVYWRQDAAPAISTAGTGGAVEGWRRRDFDRWVPLEPHRPVLHVNWYEAEAYCLWAGRRLPSEPEWEMAACWDPAVGRKRRFPWGDEEPAPERANLDWRARGALEVEALPAGDGPLGCRQMIGNVWEWTSSEFAPYPGFVSDPYKEYSEPWFHTHKVLRGGCWATRSRLIRSTWRNFYEPHRRDVWAGFRTCAR